ncbi:MAG: hypothetical protein C4290_13540 [Chloroflexota bacterium]
MSRIRRLIPALLAGLAAALALSARPVAAAPLLVQEAGGADRLQVMLWTLAAVIVAVILLAIGYVYRRAAGVDKPPPVTLLEPGRKITSD